MTEQVDLDRVGTVAVLTVDNPPVNAIGHGVRAGIVAGMERIAGDGDVRAVVIACAGRTFIAGADITEFGKPLAEPGLARMLDAIEACPKPVVAAIHGTALGGGLEVALACHFRVAVPAARFGLPEVKLGLIPGGGGTQRLPRLVGAERALEMILWGEPIDGEEALAAGLVDALVDGEPAAGAVAFAKEILARERPAIRVRDLDGKLAATRGGSGIFAAAREEIARRRPGFDAPASAVDAVEAAVTLPFAAGLARERVLFDALMSGEQSRAQRYFFFAEREAGKIPDVPRDTPVSPVENAAVLGAGTMGTGIAMCFADAGVPVTVVEVDDAALERGLATIRGHYERSAARGTIPPGAVEERMGRIRGGGDLDAVGGADCVVEAVFEDLALKRSVFADLDRVAKSGALLATNTSFLDVNEIAAATGRPESVLGLHFFSPANRMRLVEVVRGARTSGPVLATAMALARRLGKVPVPVGVGHGFVANRMLEVRGREAERLLLEGASPERVDRVLRGFGFPMGPFAVDDMAGLDIGWDRDASAGGTVRDRLCEAGRLGQKTGAGYYRYEPGDRMPHPDPAVERTIRKHAEERGVASREIADEEILDRCIYPVIDEGVRILGEGIARRASDIDVIWVHGIGWPVYRGGPMFHADAVGLDAVLSTLNRYRNERGDGWAPADRLAALAAAGESLTGGRG